MSYEIITLCGSTIVIETIEASTITSFYPGMTVTEPDENDREAE